MNEYNLSTSSWQRVANPSPHRYWSPETQLYAGGDHLLRYLEHGWQIEHGVETETHWFGEARYVVVYRFPLVRGGQRLVMPVVGNPFVRQLVREPERTLAQVTTELRAMVAAGPATR